MTIKSIWNDFVAFIMTDNVLMLAVAFVMGGLTKKVIDDFVAFIINPFIGAIVGKPEFSNTLKIGEGVIQYNQPRDDRRGALRHREGLRLLSGTQDRSRPGAGDPERGSAAVASHRRVTRQPCRLSDVPAE
ncbi:MAG: MscL family protein [Actinobacteria bacterium]|nr:MscL family protein [Actinomycetota bacterium]